MRPTPDTCQATVSLKEMYRHVTTNIQTVTPAVRYFFGLILNVELLFSVLMDVISISVSV